MSYPDEYISDAGLKVRKFEKDMQGVLEYEFVGVFLLLYHPCLSLMMRLTYYHATYHSVTLDMWFISKCKGRFGSFSPFDQSQFNIGGLAGVAGNLVDAAVTNLTGNRFLGDLSE